MFDIEIGTNGLETVYVRHEPTDAEKIIRLREDMMSKGWHGRPVILADCIDHHRALTGSHRLAAAAGLDGVEINMVLLPDLTGEDWITIDDANDDDELLAALESIAEYRDDMTAVIETMRAEIDANLS